MLHRSWLNNSFVLITSVLQCHALLNRWWYPHYLCHLKLLSHAEHNRKPFGQFHLMYYHKPSLRDDFIQISPVYTWNNVSHIFPQVPHEVLDMRKKTGWISISAVYKCEILSDVHVCLQISDPGHHSLGITRRTTRSGLDHWFLVLWLHFKIGYVISRYFVLTKVTSALEMSK